jgi:hypothetical protein
MARVKDLVSFVLILAGMLLALRAVHVVVPMLFADSRSGPVSLTRLEDVQRHAGFAPLVPAYRPEALGERPAQLTVTRAPYPTFSIVWRGERYLALTQRRGGASPSHPATSVELADVPGSLWWWDGGAHHLVLRRDDFWIVIETDLPQRDLRRIADTLRPFPGGRAQPSSIEMMALRMA